MRDVGFARGSREGERGFGPELILMQIRITILCHIRHTRPAAGACLVTAALYPQHPITNVNHSMHCHWPCCIYTEAAPAVVAKLS